MINRAFATEWRFQKKKKKKKKKKTTKANELLFCHEAHSYIGSLRVLSGGGQKTAFLWVGQPGVRRTLTGTPSGFGVTMSWHRQDANPSALSPKSRTPRREETPGCPVGPEERQKILGGFPKNHSLPEFPDFKLFEKTILVISKTFRPFLTNLLGK